MMKYGRYEIVKEVGKGGMGIVYEAHDPEIDRKVALKVLREDRIGDSALVGRFIKEAKAIGRLSHPNIVTVYDVGRDHNTIFIAMEFLEGEPLNKIIAQGLPSHKKMVELGVQMAEAVHYAHEKGIIHRDIKPTNIIVTPSGNVKITDFGIARVEDASVTQYTQAGEILGTPVYMSPEQVMGKPVDGRSDLYSLGVILYELGTGQRPFAGGNLAALFAAITQNELKPPREIVPTLPSPLEHLIIKSLHKNPEERFQTGRAMAQALKSALRESDETVLSLKDHAEPHTKRSSLIWVMVAFVIFAVVGLSYFFLRPDNEPPSPQNTVLSPPEGTSKSPEAASVKLGFLKVESAPPGAQVFLDGLLKGQSPLNAQLPVGKHEIRLLLPGHYEWKAQVKLQEEKETPLSVRLIPENVNP